MKRLRSVVCAAAVAAVAAVTGVTGVVGVSGAPAARAADNGVERTPVLGWSSWSFIRNQPTAAKIEAQADALRSSGL